MSYAFDCRAFAELVNESARLATFVRDHESRLARLAIALDGTPSAAVTDDVRALCADAHARRVTLETLLGRVLGLNGSALSHAQRPRVLIADDSDDNRELTANLLDVSGFAPIATRNGLEALMAANCLAPAVVLMDVSMPILDGIETARLLRASPVTREVPVIAHTAWPSFFDGPGRDVFAAVLPKPTTPEALLASVQRFAAPSPR
jgi:two-component system, cell cycle response regulator DivK